MKKLFLVLVVALLAVGTVDAQVMTKGDKALNLGIGIPSSSYSIRLPSLIGSFDVGITDKLGIGYLSAGGLATFYTRKWNNSWYGGDYSSRYTAFVGGGRAAYHFDFAEMTGGSGFDKLDIYAGMFMGMRFWSYKYDDDWNDDSNGSDFLWDGFVGIRFNLSDSFALYAEAGGYVNYLSGGVSFRF